jgi:dolichol-phosphate mannosyltransferase
MSGTPWIVLPTYNESDNLPGLVAAVHAVLPEARVLVVDDNSPDGTGAVAERLEGVDVLHRPVKQGLGPAYVAGFARVLELGAEYVFEMDADFSHDPADLPRLLAAVREGADLAVGSRYVPGGAVENWHWLRRAVSRAGCLYARAVLRVPVRDLTGGFKCFRAETLRAIDYSTVRSRGYAFQVELSYRTLLAGRRVHELPIVFHERREGHSKMTGRIALEAVWLLPRLRWAQARRARCR